MASRGGSGNPTDPNTWLELLDGERPSWDELFLMVAAAMATRSTCSRADERRGPACGCVLVLDHRIVAGGYNGSLPGAPHCSEEGHLLIEGHCQRTVHAEQNALVNAGRPVEGATAYITRIPCLPCLKLLLAAGVRRIVCASTYKDADQMAAFAMSQAGIHLEYPGAEHV